MLLGVSFGGMFAARLNYLSDEDLSLATPMKSCAVTELKAVFCDIPGPRMRGTGGTLISSLEISRDRGHPPGGDTPKEDLYLIFLFYSLRQVASCSSPSKDRQSRKCRANQSVHRGV